MQPHFFGEYLVAQGLISREQLDQALAEQRRSNRLVGEMAVEAGLLTPWQVRDILALQRLSDLSFGEIAVAGGFAPKPDLENLLFKQRVRTVHLGEALLAQGHLSHEQFSKAMENFFNCDARRREAMRQLFSPPMERQVLWAMVQSLERAFLRLLHLPLKTAGLMDQEQDFSAALGLEVQMEQLGLVKFVALISDQVLAQAGPAGDGPCQRPVQALDLLVVAGHYFRQALDQAGLSTGEASGPMVLDMKAPGGREPSVKLHLCSPVGSVGLWAFIGLGPGLC